MSEALYPDLKSIRSCLIRGDIKRIADENNVSEDYVSKVISGRRKSVTVAQAVTEKATRNKAMEKATLEALKRTL